MTIAATYSINNPAALSQGNIDLVIGVVNEAFRLWSGVLAGDASVNVRLDFIDTDANRATGGWTNGVFTGSAGGFSFYVGNPAAELMAGLNSATQTDITITIDPDYLRNELFLDPTPATRTGIPVTLTDGLSVMLHEIGHALGFIGYYREADNTFDFASKTLYDYRLTTVAGEAFFDGPNVRKLTGAAIPLTDNNYAHYGNSSAFPGTSSDPLLGLMNGVVFYRGYAYSIGELDLAVLADTGLGTIRDDILDIPFLASMRGGAGNDVITGGSIANQLFGDDGTDTLRGNGGNDAIDGGSGIDTAVFSGVRSAYSITVAATGVATVTGPDGTDTVRNTEFLQFGDQTVAINTLGPSAGPGFRLFAAAGWTGSVGGEGTVTGTNGAERVEIINRPGTIVLDGSFSRGNDVIVLQGTAAAWSVNRRSASVATFSDGDSFVDIPVGGSGTAILFDDGVRLLKFDATATMAIGTQAIGTSLSPILAPATASSAPDGTDPAAPGRMFLSPGADAAVGGRVLVVGTNSADLVRPDAGSISLDGSFTRGNDTLVLDHAAGSYRAVREGTLLRLTGNGLDLLTPVGGGLLLDFTDSDRTLAFSGQSMVIGSQVIETTAQFLIG